MFQLGDAAPEDSEPHDGDVPPQQGDAMFGDHIIGEHAVDSSDDDSLICKPCAEDDDSILNHAPTGLTCPPEFTKAQWTNLA